MMAVDTSALMAVILNEPEAARCVQALTEAPSLLISAGTMAEALIVAENRGVGAEMALLLDGLGFEVIAVTAPAARRMKDAYLRRGRGHHPAALNFGDCFAYDIARSHACKLLFVGNDFTKADVISAFK